MYKIQTQSTIKKVSTLDSQNEKFIDLSTNSGYINGKVVSNTTKDAKNTAEYVVARLVDLGITNSFTVPGDYSFTLDRALISNSELVNIGCANELNASYAADGYAREKGAAILCTTYAVGELSAINGVMGSKAENNVVFHLVGSPATTVVNSKKQVHHTLGDGVFGQFISISSMSACVTAVITPDNVVREMNRVIRNAFKFRQPAYITLSLDKGRLPVTDNTIADTNCAFLVSQSAILEKAIALIIDKISRAKSIVVVPSVKLDRYDLTNLAIKFIEKLNVPFVVMPHDKAVIDQDHPQYLGYYAGKLSDNGVSDIVESADLIIDLGGVYWSDFNTAGFSNNLDLSKVLSLAPLFVRDKKNYFEDIYLLDVLTYLLKKIPSKNYIVKSQFSKKSTDLQIKQNLKIESVYEHISNFLRKDDVLVVETGSSSINMPAHYVPKGVKYHNQTLWGSIGWATPATLGVALASPHKRVVLLTGEGSHQLTLNELGVMGRYGINPIIICINNNGFMVERSLEIDPNPSYDDLAQLNYSLLPNVFGCHGWLSFKVTSNVELSDALQKARMHKSAVYIEIVTGKYDYGNALFFYNTIIEDMYS